MKLTINPTVLYRIPKFPMNATMKDSWQELKEAISLSSAEFYQIIKDAPADQIDNLPAATQYTLWKYFNRAKYRSTPYATFASIGVAKLEHQSQSNPIILEDQQHLHTFTDWPHKDDILITAEEIAEKNLKLFSNSSYYRIKDSIRYISHLDGEFQISEIQQDDLVLEILETCTKPVSYNDLLKALTEKGFDTEAPIELFDILMELQLLFSSLHPNIIGQDYFQRIGIPEDRFPNKYIIAERKTDSGTINQAALKDLPELISLLHGLAPTPENKSLEQFISRFSQRFGDEQIPLMQALDPEMGIGYNDLEQGDNEEEFIQKFAAKKNTDIAKPKDPFKEFALNQLLQGTGRNRVIRLEQLKLEPNKNPLPLPNSTSVLCSPADDLIQIDSIGGNTANALLGRFSPTNKTILEHCRNIASQEQSANPDIQFFDVAYTAENKVDNVNRRESIYPMQLSILNYDTSAEPIPLTDILISTSGNKLNLHSKKTGKKLIPRFTTAYNYVRSDLAVFRLLCDLQSQGIQGNLNLNLQSALEDAPYYPRLQYKNLVLSPARWKLNHEDYTKKDASGTSALKTYLQQNSVSRFFKAGLADQTLCFDQQNEDDLVAFIQYSKKHKSFYIEEAMIPEHSGIIDRSSQSYKSQFLLSLVHTEEIYKVFPTADAKADNSHVQKIIAPGNQWLYFEIYSHVTRTDELLATRISDFLAQHQHLITKWFFIRYNENGDHLRLRILLKDPKHGQQLTQAFSSQIKEELEAGIVSELLIKTYKREMNRYGCVNYELVESHFHQDSEYVLNLISSNLSAQEKYQLCINLAQKIKLAGLFTPEAFKHIVSKVSDAFGQEHKITVADYKELNTVYKKYRETIWPELDPQQQELYANFIQSMISTLQNCEALRRRQLFSDLIHMHVNRLFTSNQRTHEMAFYYILSKEILRQAATSSTEYNPISTEHTNTRKVH